MFNFILPKMILKIERWKWNKEFRVYVSTLGNFKDEHKNNLPMLINNGGYLLVKTPYGIKLAHRLVMMTWVPIPNAEDLTVDHLNHNKRDNSIYNLEWVTRIENLERAKKDMVIDPTVDNNAASAGNSKKNPLIFATVEEAFGWLYTNNRAIGNNPSIVPDKIKKKIIAASANGIAYCGKFWRIG